MIVIIYLLNNRIHIFLLKCIIYHINLISEIIIPVLYKVVAKFNFREEGFECNLYKYIVLAFRYLIKLI